MTFGPDFEDLFNEATYVINVIIPTVQSTLKNLLFRKTAFISTSEWQSLTSADRKGDGQMGRRPDMMFEFKYNGKVYELMFVECSRLSCTKRKELDDMVKLWRETNDGLYWARKGCKPEKEQFGIVGIQVAGKIISLYFS